MGTQTRKKRQLQEVEDNKRKKQATRGQSVATEVRIPPLPSSDSRVNLDSPDSFLSHHDADNQLPRFQQQKSELPIHTSSARVAAPSTIPQCQLCQRVARALHPDSGYRVPRHYNPNGWRSIKLGFWQEILRNRTCSTCSRIAELFIIEFQGNEGDHRAAEYEFWVADNAFTRVILKLKSESHRREPSFDIFPLARGISEPVGVLMDRCWIDSEWVLQWIKSCDTMHAECHCNISASSASFSQRDMYLISVSRKCLVKANSGEKYVALSYVWGASCSQFRTTKANLTFLQSEGSLDETTRDHLPGTIKRAMHFTTLLDVDFLWVDCLCIVQDDPFHAASQINSMASIYSNSYLTLCAADGVDAESGLLGIRQCSPPRNVQQDVLAFADGPMSSKWVKFMPVKVSVYDERGWTFQEGVLSRRSLSFTETGLVWRCREINAEEQRLEATPSALNVLDGKIVRADTLWPCVRTLDRLVNSYLLERRLTYEEDILQAFSGILELFSSSMLGGFFFGLPQLFFDAALLWVPKENLTRCEGVKSEIVKNALPSWSWAGWKGARRTQMHAFGLGHERSFAPFYYQPRMGDYIRDINPCVTWFKIDKDTGEKVRIPNDYSRFRDDGLNGTIKLPLGWSSHYVEKDREEGYQRYYYRYDKAPHSCTFWYPIPTLRGIQPASDRQWGPILYCKTLRGYLRMGNPVLEPGKHDSMIFPTYTLHGGDHIYSLYASEGTWAGIIYVHHSPESASERNQQCELVLISGGWAVEDHERQWAWFPEWFHGKRPCTGSLYHFYHVLWIEWQDKIAYRKGLGRVVQKVWDDLPKDEIELYLG